MNFKLQSEPANRTELAPAMQDVQRVQSAKHRLSSAEVPEPNHCIRNKSCMAVACVPRCISTRAYVRLYTAQIYTTNAMVAAALLLLQMAREYRLTTLGLLIIGLPALKYDAVRAFVPACVWLYCSHQRCH